MNTYLFEKFPSGAIFAVMPAASLQAPRWCDDKQIRAFPEHAAFDVAVVMTASDRTHMKLFKSVTKQLVRGFGNQSLSPERLADPKTECALVVPIGHVRVAIQMKRDTSNRSSVLQTTRVNFGL